MYLKSRVELRFWRYSAFSKTGRTIYYYYASIHIVQYISRRIRAFWESQFKNLNSGILLYNMIFHHFGLHYLKPFSTFIITSGLSLFYCGYIYTHLKLQNNHLLHSNSSFFIVFTHILTFTSYIQNHTFNHDTKTFNKQTSHFHYLQLWIDCPLPILSIYLYWFF